MSEQHTPEPFGYFKAEPFGWTDCAETDEGAQPLWDKAVQDHQQARINALEKVIQRQQFIEDRYEELMLSCRRVYRYYGADQELFNASVKVMNFLIRRHATEIDEMDEDTA